MGLCRFTRDDNWIWGHVINELLSDFDFTVTKLRDGTERRALNHSKVPLTRLMIYARRGRLDLVQRAVVEYRADVNRISKVLDPCSYPTPGREEVMATPLTCAIKGGFDDVAEWLLAHKADPSQVWKKSMYVYESPLDLAVEKGSLRVVKTLIETYVVELDGTELEMEDRKFCQLLSNAIEKQHNDIVTYLVRERGVHANYPSDENVWSYVSDAVIAENWDAFLLLLEHGAVVNFVNGDGETPLIIAACLKRVDFTFALLQRGADPNLAEGWQNLTPLLAAARANNAETAGLIVQAGGNALAAINIVNMDDIDDFLEQGKTALHFFASHGNPAGVVLVLQAGAEFDAVTFAGLTPLLICIKSLDEGASAGRIGAAITCCNLLTLAGADVNHVRNLDEIFDDVEEESLERGFTAATYAVERNVPALLSCLVRLGADITHCPDDNVTLLMRAARLASVECVKILLETAAKLPAKERRAFLDRRDSVDEVDDLNAIGHCIQEPATPGAENASELDSNRVTIIRMLLSAGVPWGDGGRVESETPAMRAISLGNTVLFKVLLDTRPPDADGAEEDIFEDDRVGTSRSLLRAAIGIGNDEISVFIIDKHPDIDG